MNTRFPLTATLREKLGHESKNLRKSGLIPATVYGKGAKSITLAIKNDEFVSIYKQAGETHIVDLTIDGKTHPVLVHAAQKHPMSRAFLNVEFHTVNLTEKLKTYVPVQITGESPAVTEKKGTLLTTLQEVEVESLPTNIPESISVDVSSLAEVDQEIKVSQLVVPQGVTVLSDAEQTVVKVGAIVVEKVEEPVAGTAADAAETSKDGEASPAPEQSAKAE